MGPGVRAARPDHSGRDSRYRSHRPLKLSLNRPKILLNRETMVAGTFVLDDYLNVPQGLDHQLQHYHGSRVALPRTDLDDPGVAARPLLEARRQGIEQLIHHCRIVDVREKLTTDVQGRRVFAFVIISSANSRTSLAFASVVWIFS